MTSLQPILIKLRRVNFQKSMGHEGSNKRVSENVRRVDVLFVSTKKEFLTICLHRLTC